MDHHGVAYENVYDLVSAGVLGRYWLLRCGVGRDLGHRRPAKA